ncbi:hypothetical protein GGI13_006812, partial [Coemansia sp. RSA 455]
MTGMHWPTNLLPFESLAGGKLPRPTSVGLGEAAAAAAVEARRIAGEREMPASLAKTAITTRMGRVVGPSEDVAAVVNSTIGATVASAVAS